MEAAKIKLRTLFAAVLSVVFLELLGGKIIHMWGAPALAALGCLRLLDIAVLVYIVIRYEESTKRIGLGPTGIPAAIRKGALWSLAFGLGAGSCVLILNGFGFNLLPLMKTLPAKSMSEAALYFLVGGIISPAAEEIFFRGLVFLFFRQWGFLQALVLSTTFFTLLHPLSSGIPLPQIVGGLLFATAFEVEKNLLVPVVIHVSGNLAIFALSWLTV